MSNINHSKFSSIDLFTLSAALAFGFVCFLGANFYSLGNSVQSVVLAVIITCLLGGTAIGAKLLKRTGSNFKICLVFEIIFLVIFLVFAVFFANLPFRHFFFVVLEQKDEIRDKLTVSITQAENMFADYELYVENRENNYERKLRSVAAAKRIKPSEYKEYGFENNGVSDNKQIENMMFKVHADLFPTNYSDSINKRGIKETASAWLADAKSKTNAWWNFIGIVKIVNEVEESSNDWLNKLKELSLVREKGEETEDFNCNLSFDDIKSHFTALGNFTLLSLSTLLSALAYLLMLLPYIFSWRSSKNSYTKSNERDTHIK